MSAQASRFKYGDIAHVRLDEAFKKRLRFIHQCYSVAEITGPSLSSIPDTLRGHIVGFNEDFSAYSVFVGEMGPHYGLPKNFSAPATTLDFLAACA